MTSPCMELYKHAEKEQKRFRANQVRLAPAPDENRFARDVGHAQGSGPDAGNYAPSCLNRRMSRAFN